jgi:TatD DNase family protein
MIDLHCHLDLYPDPHGVTARCKRDGHYVLSVTTTPKAWRGTRELAGDASRIRTSLGLHPQVAHQRHGELALFEGLLPEARYVGEIGLDGSPEFRVHHAVQRRCFDRILASCAQAGGRVMTVHSRGAADAVLDALEQHPNAGTAVLHWFSGTRKQLDRAVGMGCWFSVGPAMVKGQKGRELLRAMPPERVLTETDGPFAQGQCGPLLPGEVTLAVEACSNVWSMASGETEAKLTQNLRALVATAEPLTFRENP